MKTAVHKKVISLLLAMTMVASLSADFLVEAYAAGGAVTAEVQGTYTQSSQTQEVVIRVNVTGVTVPYCGFVIDGGVELPDGFVIKGFSTSNTALPIKASQFNTANGKLTYSTSDHALEDTIPADTYYEVVITAPANAAGTYTVKLRDISVANRYAKNVLVNAAEVSVTFTINTVHTHAFDQQVATDPYKAAQATCTAKATYYYSCSCGEKGAATFQSGELAAHTYDNGSDTICNECGYVRTTGGSGSGSSGGGGGAVTYAITIQSGGNGQVVSNYKSASEGDVVTLTVSADNGYELDKLTVLNGNGGEIAVTKKGDNKYTFKMPDGKVRVEAVFEGIAPANPFTDVAQIDYYYDAVLWAVANGITSGTSETTFSPDAVCTRAQTMTFLWRVAGSPKPTATACPFTDVTPDKYYYDAVVWAVENGITAGTSATTFSPDATVTRAQNVTFLWRLAGTPAAKQANAFVDVAVDQYYHNAVIWAAEQGITAGTSATTFGPADPCLRSQIMTFLYRFVTK